MALETADGEADRDTDSEEMRAVLIETGVKVEDSAWRLCLRAAAELAGGVIEESRGASCQEF